MNWELVLACLAAIELCFSFIHFGSAMFLRLDKGIKHKVITSFVVTVSYIIETFVDVFLSKPAIFLDVMCIIAWGLFFGWSLIQLTIVKKILREKEQ